ncbi:MAG TPA: alpha/beta hydrolase [Myxococcota bacterium]|nr:alpha/beta hydrolase [Myxococcota bacterium]
MILLLGCMTMDGFFFDPVEIEDYDFDSDVAEVVEFESTDGTLLYGVWLRQPEPTLPTDPVPRVLVHHHGNKGNLEFHFDRLELYYDYGYTVFSYDYRGYGLSQGTPTHDDVLRDGLAAMELVLADPDTPDDSREVLVHGTSLGGYVSLQTSSDHPPRALVTEDVFANVDRLIETNAGVAIPRPWMFEGEWDATAAAAKLDEVPYLVIHGAEDTYVRTEHARWLYAAAVEPKSLWLVPGGDHGPASDSPRHYELLPEEYEERLKAWYAEDEESQ